MGLIHKIISSDIFIVLDDVQLVRGKNFVTRTQIKTSGGPKWLTIPVNNKNDFLPISQIKINNEINWQEEHWNKIFENYKKTKYFNKYEKCIKKIIFEKKENISKMNTALITQILDILNIKRDIRYSSELNVNGKGLEKIVNLIKMVEADEYVSGQGKGSLRYITGNEQIFKKNEINLQYQEFNHPKYFQIHGDFAENLSILDIIFNLGPEDTLKKLKLD
jgi:hypothetical protein